MELLFKGLKIKFLVWENVKWNDGVTITSWVSTHPSLLDGDFSWHLFRSQASPWVWSRGCPTWPSLHLLCLNLLLLSIRALRFSNAGNSPGTCSYVLALISSLRPAAGSSVGESALTFSKAVCLGGRQDDASQRGKQVEVCVATAACWMCKDWADSNQSSASVSLFLSAFPQNQYCTALFRVECNKFLCVQSQWEEAGYVSGKKNSFIMLISWWHCRKSAGPPGYNLASDLTACTQSSSFFFWEI